MVDDAKLPSMLRSSKIPMRIIYEWLIAQANANGELIQSITSVS